MEKTEQLKSILTELDNKELTKHQAHDLICVLCDLRAEAEQLILSGVSKSVNCDHNYPPVNGWNIHQPQHCSNCGKDL